MNGEFRFQVVRKIQPLSTYATLSHNLASSQPHLTTKPPLSPPTCTTRVLNRHSKVSVSLIEDGDIN